MAPRGSKSKRAPRRRRGGPRRRLGLKRGLANSEFASMKQTISLSNDQFNTVYKLEDISLSAFDRAVQVARAYQYFRMTKVEVQFKPFVDTFTNSTTQSVPYLYYLIIKNDATDTSTFNQMRDAGAKPVRFDDRTKVIRWKPAVQNQVIGEDVLGAPTVTAWAESRISPWLSTSYQPATDSILWSPSKVPHKGLMYGVQEDFSTVTQYYEVTITAHFQFKKPLGMTAIVPGAAVVGKPIRDKEEAAEAAALPPASLG